MTRNARNLALEKLAFYGPAYVPGAPVFGQPPMTVGQVMYNAGADDTLTRLQRRSITDSIVNTGKDVNAPATSLLHAGIGALAGNFISKTLNASPFWQGVATAAGANYGYTH